MCPLGRAGAGQEPWELILAMKQFQEHMWYKENEAEKLNENQIDTAGATA